MKLTPAQINGLVYYASLTIADKKERKKARAGVKHPDTRVDAALLEKGLIDQVVYSYGPLWGITEAGRAQLAAAK